MSSVAEIDQFLHEAVARRQIPCVAAIVADKNQVLYHQAFGKLENSARQEMPSNAIFRIMSMTKPITSVLVMALYEQGKIGLDDPIRNICPS